MENLFIFLATSFALRRLSGPRKIRNCFIGNTGCSALVFAGDNDFNYTVTRTGDDLFFHEYREKKVSFGIICIRLNKEYNLQSAEELLKIYINKLRKPFHIKHNTGLIKDDDWNQVSSSTLTDYWQDQKRMDWKVKGYTNGNYMAVLYVKNIGHTDVNKQDLFLDSFHFGHSR